MGAIQHRRTTTRLLGTVLASLAAATLVLGVPGMAASHPDRHDGVQRAHHKGTHRYEQRQRRHAQRRHHRQHRASYRHESAYRPGYARSARRFYRQAAYFCAPCEHYFRARNSLYEHVHRQHRVAIWRLPRLIVHSAIGWVFYG